MFLGGRRARTQLPERRARLRQARQARRALRRRVGSAAARVSVCTAGAPALLGERGRQLWAHAPWVRSAEVEGPAASITRRSAPPHVMMQLRVLHGRWCTI